MNERRIPDLVVEQLALGELDRARVDDVRRALAATADARLADIEQSNAAILERLPPDVFARHIRQRTEERPTPRRIARGVVALSSVATVALVWLMWPEDAAHERGDWTIAVLPDRDSDFEHTRIKGLAPRLSVYLEVPGDDPRKLQPGDRVSAGSNVQVGYIAAGSRHGVILSIDGRGVVTLHHPAQTGADTSLVERGETPLPHSYRLDDAPGFERFFFVTTGGAGLDVEAVHRAVEALNRSGAAEHGRLELPPTLMQSSFLLRK